MSFLQNYFLSLRPKQWIKNSVIFLPIIFSGTASNMGSLGLVVLIALLFSLLMGSLYIINDIIDIKKDQLHPTKSRRPIAAEKITVQSAGWFAGISIVLLLYILFFLHPLTASIALLYVLNTLAYSLYLKKIVLLDVISIAFGFLGRVWIGAAIIDVVPSAWLLVMIFFGALYLGFLKRYQEKRLQTSTRAVLRDYGAAFLEQIISVMMALLIITYSLYTFQGSHGSAMLSTVPFVVYGVLRLQYSVFQKECWSQSLEELVLQIRAWSSVWCSIFCSLYFLCISMKLLPILLSVSLTGFSQLFFRIGMRDFHFTNVGDFLWFILTSPWILLGLFLMGLGVIVWFFVLSKNDVSYAYPFVSVAFMIVLIGGYCMGESLGMSRLVGFGFLMIGMFFIAR